MLWVDGCFDSDGCHEYFDELNVLSFFCLKGQSCCVNDFWRFGKQGPFAYAPGQNWIIYEGQNWVPYLTEVDTICSYFFTLIWAVNCLYDFIILLRPCQLFRLSNKRVFICILWFRFLQFPSISVSYFFFFARFQISELVYFVYMYRRQGHGQKANTCWLDWAPPPFSWQRRISKL